MLQNQKLLLRDVFQQKGAIVHINLETEFVLVRKGVLKTSVNGETRELKAGECMVIFPYQTHAFEIIQKVEAMVIMIPYVAAKAFVDACRNQNAAPCVFSLSEPLWQYLLSVLPSVENTEDAVLIGSVLYPLAAEYMRNALLRKEIRKKTHENADLDCVIEWLYQNKHEDITLKKIQKAFGMQAAELNEMFASLAVKPLEFLNNLRIEEACIMLQTTKLSVTEIAYECGMGSVRTFNRIFQKSIGCTPSAFRRLHT